MNKRKFSILPLLLVLVLLLSGCDTWVTNQQAVKPTNNKVPPVTDPSGNVDPNPFTCTLTFNGEPFIPKEPIEIQWNDGYSMRSAPVDENGVARCGGLDGDYRVTLSSLPEGYYYNPNINFASNSNRHIEIKLQAIVPTEGSGINLYEDCITVRHTGVYCVPVTSPDKEVYFEFIPTEAGTYYVESWMDTVADEVDPGATRYTESFAYKKPLSYHDDGGEEGTYTKNFSMPVEMAQDYFGDNGETQASFTFGIRATTKSGEYPVNVYIAITYEYDFILPYVPSKLVGPAQPLKQAPEGNGEFVYPEVPVPGGISEFRGEDFKLWPESEGGDGYYHVFDEEKYPETFGYGPILYADISGACRFMSDAFSTLEYQGNKFLTLGETNYKLMIEGFAYLASWQPDPVYGKNSYFCDKINCPCIQSNTCESVAICDINGACTEDCPNCADSCRPCPEELMGVKGYADMSNADGRYPVTEELKTFLQLYSTTHQLFFDGEGTCETHPQYPIFATEDDQWLYACGYYAS